MEHEEEQKIEMYDRVRIKGADLVIYTVVGIGPGTSFKLQRGNDASSWQQIDGSKLVIVSKAEKSQTEPGFVPDRSITDVGY
jgi:hypothetical protein